MRKCGKIVKSRAGHRWKHGACALHAGYLRLHMHKPRLCNSHCFSKATMVVWRRLNVTLYVHCLSCLIPYLNYIFILHFPDEMLQSRHLIFSLASAPKPAFPNLFTRRFLQSQNETSCTPFQWPLNWNFRITELSYSIERNLLQQKSGKVYGGPLNLRRKCREDTSWSHVLRAVGLDKRNLLLTSTNI